MKKSEMNFKDSKSLASVRNVINEANEALNNKSRTIATSAIPETLAGALGAGVGGVASFSDTVSIFQCPNVFRVSTSAGLLSMLAPSLIFPVLFLHGSISGGFCIFALSLF